MDPVVPRVLGIAHVFLPGLATGVVGVIGFPPGATAKESPDKGPIFFFFLVQKNIASLA